MSALLDRHLNPANVIRVEAIAHASLEATWEAIWNADISGSPLVKALFVLRGIPNLLADLAQGKRIPPPPKRFTFGDMPADAGWVILEEEPGRERVIGLIGQFWRPVLRFQSYAPEEFRAWTRPGFAKCAVSFRVEPLGEARTRLIYECRTDTTNGWARFMFGGYWLLIHRFVRVIMQGAADAIAREAQGERASDQSNRKNRSSISAPRPLA